MESKVAQSDVDKKREHHHKQLKGISLLAIIALILQTGLLLLSLFGPALPYIVSNAGANDPTSDEFLATLGAITGARASTNSRFEVLPNGDNFYKAELQAISGARKSVCLEAYIFQDGEIGRRMVEALAERARSGVAVRMVLDAVGSASLTAEKLKPISDAGGRFAWYHPLRWYTWPRINNRTHRELLVVDGQVAFIGGAGIADQWWKQVDKQPKWRDTVVRVEGPAVMDLQGTLAENWLESSGEVLTGDQFFNDKMPSGPIPALVVRSSPTEGRSTPARVLFQTLLASAKHTIHITTPYFLPDKSMRDELTRAIGRGVQVQILTPGPGNDHLVTRTSSRHLYGDILQAHGSISEYQPSMIHAKVLIIDSLWAVVGSTNMDPRSFSLNDEVNLAVRDSTLAATLESDFRSDLQNARPISYEEWKRRPIWERITEFFGSLIEKQQ